MRRLSFRNESERLHISLDLLSALHLNHGHSRASQHFGKWVRKKGEGLELTRGVKACKNNT
jgi:hypothetical protein